MALKRMSEEKEIYLRNIKVIHKFFRYLSRFRRDVGGKTHHGLGGAARDYLGGDSRYRAGANKAMLIQSAMLDPFGESPLEKKLDLFHFKMPNPEYLTALATSTVKSKVGTLREPRKHQETASAQPDSYSSTR